MSSSANIGRQHLSQIRIRDPFVVAGEAERRYYLYKSVYVPPESNQQAVGFDGYCSSDLELWEGPFPVFRPPAGFWSTQDFWAAEVHAWRGKYYLFASFKAEGKCRGTQIMVSDSLRGPFLPMTDGPVTPREWECLDGTLWVENGQPWIVFCHEWTQISDGTICALPLSEDLCRATAQPITLFPASQAPWVRPITAQNGIVGQVTDGPFLHRMAGGELVMLWSSFGKEGYGVGLARSRSGQIIGPWANDPEPMFSRDGGHCMLFRTFEGRMMLALHQPNQEPNERARLLPVAEAGGQLKLL